MTGLPPGTGWYLRRARDLLARHTPAAPGVMSAADLVHLRYLADPPPAERSYLEHEVVPGIGFGIAMRILFEELNLVPHEHHHTILASASGRLLAGLGSESEELAPVLHSRLSSVVADDMVGAAVQR